MTRFTEILQSVQSSGAHRYRVDIPADWLQGRTAFGGLSSAVIVEAMLRIVPDQRPLRSIAVSFIGPVPAGRHEIRLRLLRQGGSVSHVQGELLCDGQVATSVNAAFGRAVPGSVSHNGARRPETLRPVDDCPSLPVIAKQTPTFMQHFDMRFSHGAMPLSGADSADYGVWLRFKESTPISVTALIALGDTPTVPGLNQVTPPAVASSLTWYLEFPKTVSHLDPRDWWYYDYRCQAAGDGYFNNYATAWTPEGEPALFSRQVAMVFEK